MRKLTSSTAPRRKPIGRPSSAIRCGGRGCFQLSLVIMPGSASCPPDCDSMEMRLASSDASWISKTTKWCRHQQFFKKISVQSLQLLAKNFTRKRLREITYFRKLATAEYTPIFLCSTPPMIAKYRMKRSWQSFARWMRKSVFDFWRLTNGVDIKESEDHCRLLYVKSWLIFSMLGGQFLLSMPMNSFIDSRISRDRLLVPRQLFDRLIECCEVFQAFREFVVSFGPVKNDEPHEYSSPPHIHRKISVPLTTGVANTGTKQTHDMCGFGKKRPLFGSPRGISTGRFQTDVYMKNVHTSFGTWLKDLTLYTRRRATGHAVRW